MFVSRPTIGLTALLRTIRILEESPTGRLCIRHDTTTVIRAVKVTERFLRMGGSLPRAEELWGHRLSQPCLARAIVRTAANARAWREWVDARETEDI